MEVQLAGGGKVGQGVAGRVEAGSEAIIHGTGYVVRIGLDVLPGAAGTVSIVRHRLQAPLIAVNLSLCFA